MRAWCHAHNIERVEGDSAWNKRHKKGQWKGPVIPFGAKVWYRPTKHKADDQQKFEQAARCGLFMGYHLLSGGKWKPNGGLLVIDLEHTFGNGNGMLDPFAPNPKYSVQHISEAKLDPQEGIVFPLKPYFDAHQGGSIYALRPPAAAQL